jgi:hypothetical protein
MQWLLTTHVRRYHKHYSSSGHTWQGRFKSFPVQRDEHLMMVLRYVLQNPIAPVCRARCGNGVGQVRKGRSLSIAHPWMKRACSRSSWKTGWMKCM